MFTCTLSSNSVKLPTYFEICISCKHILSAKLCTHMLERRTSWRPKSEALMEVSPFLFSPLPFPLLFLRLVKQKCHFPV